MTTLLVICSVWFAVAFLFVLCLGLAAQRRPILDTADSAQDGDALATVELVSRLTSLQEAASSAESKPSQIETDPAYVPYPMQSTAKSA